MMKIIEKYTKDFFKGDSRKWTLKHWVIYTTITVSLAVYHAGLLVIARLIINI